MEQQLVKQKRTLLSKIPDMKNALEAITFLNEKKDSDENVETNFEVSSNVYANATIDPSVDTVYLWLGANVMLEYTKNDALQLLTKNLSNAQQRLSVINTDIDFIKDQITITEVNIARVHNHRVSLKRAAAASK
eukprot:TRINITY_DN66355_c2_g1_i1.p2 TRINITY_DN66355_c2_g1~~TRINITY_DN66355_c2_g1_i1.p2  ORF type:complete len:134 (-),score=73.00 TRINITY_DN66355_c2_g1_i1:44-445(-)